MPLSAPLSTSAPEPPPLYGISARGRCLPSRAGETALRPRLAIIEPRRINGLRAVILSTAAVIAGLTAIIEGQLAVGLALALAGPLYIALTAFPAVFENESSPHHTAITAADILLITAIVWVTGGVHSEYYLLYYLPVLTASLRLNIRDGLTACILSGLLYVFVALGSESHPTVHTSPLARVFAVCVSAVVLVIFLSMYRILTLIRRHDAVASKCILATGRMPLWYVKKNHFLWYRQLKGGYKAPKDPQYEKLAAQMMADDQPEVVKA